MGQIVIIGAGFAGMVLSLFLKRHGIDAKIYEYRDEAFTSGGNIALAPNALRVLDHVGVYDRIRTLGYNYDNISFVNGHGSVLGSFLNGSQSHYNFAAIRVHRTVVRDALRDELQRQGIEVTYGKKCLGIVKDDASDRSVTISFADGEQVTASFVIGCDGIHSLIRKHVAPATGEPQYSGLMGIMGTVMADELEQTDPGFAFPAMLFGNTGAFAIMPASFSGDELGYFATLQVEDRDRQGWDDLGKDKKQLFDMLDNCFVKPGSWPNIVTALCTKTPPSTLTSWPFYSIPSFEKWFSPSNRVVLIGDAAHAIPPTGGQGAAMALEDAETLAYALAEVHGPDRKARTAEQQDLKVGQCIAGWNSHRHARVAKVMQFTTKNGDMRKSTNHYYEQVAKEWIMWASFKWMGTEGGARWLYEYACESVRAALPM